MRWEATSERVTQVTSTIALEMPRIRIQASAFSHTHEGWEENSPPLLDTDRHVRLIRTPYYSLDQPSWMRCDAFARSEEKGCSTVRGERLCRLSLSA